MDRAITTDQLIAIEAVRMTIGWGRVAEGNSLIGLYNLLNITPDSTDEIDLIGKYLEGQVTVIQLIKELGVQVTDGQAQEDQRMPEGEEGGEGTEGRAEQAAWDEDETD